jgi:hypothetical protein
VSIKCRCFYIDKANIKRQNISFVKLSDLPILTGREVLSEERHMKYAKQLLKAWSAANRRTLEVAAHVAANGCPAGC